MAQISREIATKDVNTWLDYKKIPQTHRDNEKTAKVIDGLIDAVCEGDLVFEAKTQTIRQKLRFAVGNDESVKEISYIPRLNDKLLRPYLKSVKSDDGDARVTSYICALTKQPRAVIDELDTIDKKTAINIVTFFI